MASEFVYKLEGDLEIFESYNGLIISGNGVLRLIEVYGYSLSAPLDSDEHSLVIQPGETAEFPPSWAIYGDLFKFAIGPDSDTTILAEVVHDSGINLTLTDENTPKKYRGIDPSSQKFRKLYQLECAQGAGNASVRFKDRTVVLGRSQLAVLYSILSSEKNGSVDYQKFRSVFFNRELTLEEVTFLKSKVEKRLRVFVKKSKLKRSTRNGKNPVYFLPEPGSFAGVKLMRNLRYLTGELDQSAGHCNDITANYLRALNAERNQGL